MAPMRSAQGSRALLVALLITATAAVAPSGAIAKSSHRPAAKKHGKKHPRKHQTNIDSPALPGLWPNDEVQTLHLHFGPFNVAPGQNNIKFAVINQRPK